MKRVMNDINGFIKLFYILSMFLLLFVFLFSGFVSADNFPVAITQENAANVSSNFNQEISSNITYNETAFLGRLINYTGPATNPNTSTIDTIKWKVTITGPSNFTADMVDLDEVGYFNPPLNDLNNETLHYPFSNIGGSLVAVGSCNTPDSHDNSCISRFVFSLEENDSYFFADKINFSSNAPIGEYNITYELINDTGSGLQVLSNDYSVIVNLVDVAPVANDDSYSTNVNVPLGIPNTTGVLINDTNAENSPLTATLVSNTSNGNLTLNSDGSFNYTPNSGFTGEDNFTYIANDSTDNSSIATVIITVNSLPVPPNPPSSGGGGGGGSGSTTTTNTINCTPNWQCTVWSGCNNEKQTRVCTDSNNCGTLENRPDILQDCTNASSETKASVEVTNQTTSIKTGFIGRATGAVIGAFGTGGALIALIFVVVLAAALITSMIILYRKNRIESIDRDVSKYMGVSNYN